MNSKTDKDTSEELSFKTSNVENVTAAAHLEDPPTHLSLNSNTESNNKEIPMQLAKEQSDSDIVAIQSNKECHTNKTDIPVESLDSKFLVEKIESDKELARDLNKKHDTTLIDTHSGLIKDCNISSNELFDRLDRAEVKQSKDSNTMVKETQPLDENMLTREKETLMQVAGDIEDAMDIDLPLKSGHQQITTDSHDVQDNNSLMDTEDSGKKAESGAEMILHVVNDNDNTAKSTSDIRIDVEDISVDKKAEISGKDLQETLESELQNSNNDDDKFKLVWEDDDDADENISETTQKNDLSNIQANTSEFENNTTALTDMDNISLDTSITSNSLFSPSKAHGLNKPNVMLEIPTQDFGEFSDDNDDCQEQLAGLAMSPDVDTGALDSPDKIITPSVVSEGAESLPADVNMTNLSQNISSALLNCENKHFETSNMDQHDTHDNKSDDNLLTKRNKAPSPIVQIEENKNENESSTIIKHQEEANTEKVGEIDSDLSDTKCDDTEANKNQKEELLIQPSTSALTENTIPNNLDAEEMSDSICLQAESLKVMEANQDLSKTKCDGIEEKNCVEGIEPQPSTSAIIEDNTLGDMPQNPDVEEMSDSLGLLAESSRVMEDDEQEEDQDDDGDEDDDSDADDDNSNQMTAENSEDSNAQHPDIDSKEVKDDTPTTSDKEASEDGMNFANNIPDAIDTNLDEIVIEEATVGDVQVEETDVNTVDEVHNGDEDKDITEQDINQEETQESVDVPMDIETVKLSDTSDTEIDNEKDDTNLVEVETNETVDDELVITNENIEDGKVKKGANKYIVDCVYLEASSSDEEVCEVDKRESESTSVKMPAGIDVISSSGGASSDIVTKHAETVISGIPKPPPLKPARINTSEVSIKTTHISKETITTPELKQESSGQVVNLDSDDEDREKPKTESTSMEEEKVTGIRCVNKKCPHNPSAQYSIADSRVIGFFEGDKKKRAYVCEDCYEIIHQKNQEFITGIQEFKPLIDFDFGNYHEELVEISDSDSEEETESLKDGEDLIGEETAKFLEGNLTDIFNDMWTKFRMDDRLEDAQAELQDELKRLQKESLEIDELFKQCQSANDKLRNELYATFEPDRHELPAISIVDVTDELDVTPENDEKSLPVAVPPQSKRPRRSTSGWWEPPTKKQAIPMGYAPIASNEVEVQTTAGKVDDDNTDISVVKLSLESAPADLPPPGPLVRAPLRVGMAVYAKKKASWLRATVTEILHTKNPADQFTNCRVRFEHKNIKDPFSIVSGRHLAYSTPPESRMIIGTRVIALFKEIGIKEYYSAGIVAEVPNPVNNYRYLIFFDDGYAQYAEHRETRLVCQSSPLVWEEVHVDSRQFVKDYITSYPERPMVRLHAGQNLKTEFRGKWLSCVVQAVDASLVRVKFADGRREWIYRGSTRLAPLFLELQAAERSRPRAAPRAMPRVLANKINMPYVEYTRSNEQAKSADVRVQNAEELRRQRAVAKKSTAASQPQPAHATNLDDVTSRVVFYTPKNAVKPHKMVPHKCGPQCRRTDVLQLKDLRTYNPLAKPLLSGWERQVVRWRGRKEVMYVGGCGRRLRNMAELHRYLQVTRSDMSVDLFDFSPNTHCLAEFVLNRCNVSKKDLSNGKENVPVPCVNYYDNSLPEFYSYNTERTPTDGVPLNLDPDFLCGCDCDDDCQDKSKCACWQLTLEGARTIRMEGDVGYVYKRLPKPLPTGIYECNSRCKCKHTCLNRVAQHPLQLKLQVFKTLNKGWGIRALNDVPEGSFLCVYAGNLLTDATATLDGLNEGDEFLAELDYIEVVEQMKEGYEDDIPDDAKEDKEEQTESSSEESEEEKQVRGEDDDDDDDFQPGYIGPGLTDFTKRLREREKKNTRNKNKEENDKSQKKEENDKNQKSKTDKTDKQNEDCITISDDESREPSCFTAAAGMRADEFVSKYKSVRTLYGEDEACYIMDAKVQGNIGRYLNHSCTPNVFVQNVFVDTHDPRFPWVAFFALTHVRAGTELTWNYNYDVGSVPGKVLYCLCGAPNCKGRLL